MKISKLIAIAEAHAKLLERLAELVKRWRNDPYTPEFSEAADDLEALTENPKDGTAT